jgi:uncharacterized membrane protein YoaK (UPF0700 family)
MDLIPFIQFLKTQTLFCVIWSFSFGALLKKLLDKWCPNWAVWSVTVTSIVFLILYIQTNVD